MLQGAAKGAAVRRAEVQSLSTTGSGTLDERLTFRAGSPLPVEQTWLWASKDEASVKSPAANAGVPGAIWHHLGPELLPLHICLLEAPWGWMLVPPRPHRLHPRLAGAMVQRGQQAWEPRVVPAADGALPKGVSPSKLRIAI